MERQIKYFLIVLGVIVLVISLGFFYYWDNADKQADGDLIILEGTLSPPSEDLLITGQQEEGYRLILCAIEEQRIYNPLNRDFEVLSDPITKCPNVAVQVNNEFNLAISNSGTKIIFEIDGDEFRTLKFIDLANPERNMNITSVPRESKVILEKLWLEDDSGFLYTVRDDEYYEQIDLSSPSLHEYYLARINEGKLSEPKLIHTSDGYHASSEAIVGFDIIKNLLILQNRGPGGAFGVKTLDLETQEITELPDEYYGGFSGLHISYEDNTIYKISSDRKKFIKQNYLTGEVDVLYEAKVGNLRQVLPNDNLDTFFFEHDTSNEPAYSFASEKREIEILKFTLLDNSIEKVHTVPRVGEITIESVSPDGVYFVYYQGDYVNEGRYTKVNKLFLVNFTTGEEVLVHDDWDWFHGGGDKVFWSLES